ncbi:MAG: alginate export family protein [Elusimicrobiales bacterium]|nr:alginate export family protein [Elusimicrobiales bacterium]
MKKLIVALAALLAASQASAGWKTHFGAEDRVRAEMREDLDLDRSADDDGWLVYQLLRVNGKATLDNYEVFAEAADLRVASKYIPKAAQRDDLDLHQAYFSAGKLLGGRFGLKVGRQEMSYGKNRLISSAPWSNRVNNTDAAVVKYKSGALAADAFYGARVAWDEDGWNAPNRHDIITGVYATWQKAKGAPLVDAYFLANYDSSNLSTLNRRTVGLRAVFTLPGGVEVDAELPYQFGRSARKSVYAHAFHLDAAKDLAIAWKPRLNAGYNYASGDKKASDSVNNTFVPLYQSTHYGYGLVDLFRWQNMEEVFFQVSASPHQRLTLTGAANFYRLPSVNDSWYGSAGQKLRTKAAAAGADHYAGRELSLMAKYYLGGGLTSEAAYAHFYSGKYARDTGSGDDADWLYLQFCLKI